jgi:hypothetical protein
VTVDGLDTVVVYYETSLEPFPRDNVYRRRISLTKLWEWEEGEVDRFNVASVAVPHRKFHGWAPSPCCSFRAALGSDGRAAGRETTKMRRPRRKLERTKI